MKREADCVFCKIANGEAPAAIVHQDERTVTFLDLFPAARGHTLVVTKDHYENLFETPAEALADVAETSRRVAAAIREAFAPDGLGVFQLNGAAAGQTVFHYHMHLLPRSEGEPLALHGRKQADADDLERLAGRLRAALEGV